MMETKMRDLTEDDFDAYFEAVHGHKPYPWQSRLTREVLAEGRWPSVINLPTGTGKTATLDTAVFTLALHPHIFPRRIVFVIDRRIVVDQVYERAQSISDAIGEANDGVLGLMRARLKLIDTDESADEVLATAALRGGIPLDGEWFRRPDQPAVMVSTVDQFGSRLLFRGYGVTPKMRPVHAGLAGNDCLVILDEVHLSQPFFQTLSDVSSNGAIPNMCAVGKELPRRFETVVMSATPSTNGARQFKLSPEDLEISSDLKRIAEARKRAKLVEIGGTRPAYESVPKRVYDLVRNLEDHEKSIGIIVNRVRTAREVQAFLRDKGLTTHLVTGRMRPIDKMRVLEQIKEAVDPGRTSPVDERTVVVATQAIEVGADFSFDALMTEVAPIDSLMQRFGRLDRRGTFAIEHGRARCWILGVASALKPNKPDPVYGDRARITWEELNDLADEGEIEVGPGENLASRLSDEASAEKPDAPLVLSSHIDAWTQTTYPGPVADPSIVEFLHGKDQQNEPDVTILWRLHCSQESLELVPPRPAEFLSVPISAVRSWLRRAAEVPVSDTATASPEEEPRRKDSAEKELSGVRKWTRGSTGKVIVEVKNVADIKPGDVLIVEPDLGGLQDGTWDPAYRPTKPSESDERYVQTLMSLDLGDQAQAEHGRRATLRLDPRLLPKEIEKPPLPADEDEAEESTEERIDDWLKSVDSLPNIFPVWMAQLVSQFVDSGESGKRGFDVKESSVKEGDDYYVLVERAVDPATLDGYDDQLSFTGSEVTLRKHLGGVGNKAADFGCRLGLPTHLVDDLRLAGELHDLGKVDSRFQDQLRGHDEVQIAEADEPLAKSLQRGKKPNPKKWPSVRHETSSVALVQSNPQILERANDPDLVLHLIASHHGFSRPFPRVHKDPNPQDLRIAGEFCDEGFRLLGDSEQGLEMKTWSDLAETPLALEIADRFWRLQKRYGHHGLAWLESIMRLADQQQSAEELRQGSEDD